MNTFSLELTTVYEQLTSFAGLESFWANFHTAFGSEYDLAKAENLRIQWLNAIRLSLFIVYPRLAFAYLAG